MSSSFTFYLDWIVCSQFAGIFWAKEHGLYEAKGLDVNVVPWHDDGRTVIEKVLDASSKGELCAGCAEDNLIVRRLTEDGSVNVFGAMFQDTPLVVMSRPAQGIRRIGDLRGKRVGMHTDGIQVLELVLALEGLARNEVELHEVGYDLDHLRLDRFDAVQGYAMTEPVQLTAMGIEVDVVPVKHHRLKPFAQTYFASSASLTSLGERFADFVSASSAGWLAVCAQPDKAAALVARLMHPNATNHELRRSMVDQRRSLDRVVPLVIGNLPIEQIGSVDISQWVRNLETYLAFGLTDRRVGLDEVVFEFAPRFA